jgi:hypothetical protein
MLEKGVPIGHAAFVFVLLDQSSYLLKLWKLRLTDRVIVISFP